MNPEERKISDILFLTREAFRVAQVEDPEREAAFLIAHYVNCRPVELPLKADEFITEEQYRDLSFAIRRRFRHEPSQYITGVQEFYGYTFKVRPGVLIPRPETELLVDEVKKSLKSKKKKGRSAHPMILDLCTGSGAVAVALAKEIPEACVFATDISKAAIGIATENAAAHGVSERIVFLSGDLYSALKGFTLNDRLRDDFELSGDSLHGGFDYILSNPPYVSTSEYKALASEIKDYEPKEALIAGPDGLKFIKKIIKDGPDFLRPGGTLMIEIGFDHSKVVKALIKDSASFEAIGHVNDLSGIARLVTARLKKSSK